MLPAQKKIVLLSAFLSPFRSGAEAMVEETAFRLASRYDITILTSRLSRSLPTKEQWTSPFGGTISIQRLGFGFAFDKYLFPFLAPIVLFFLKPDIVHAVLESYAGLALSLARFCSPRSKTMLTCQSTNTSFLLRYLHSFPNAITVISSVLLSRALSFGRSDAHLIPNGIPLANIRRIASVTSKIPHQLLFVGRLEPMKGVDILLQALAILQKKDPLLDWHLSIVGTGSEESTLQRIASDLQLEDRVSFRGRLTGEALFKEYAQAKMFCGLSRSEALGNVFLEAQAANCAIVAASVGGIPDIVEDGVTGILVPPENPEKTAEALVSLLTDRARLDAIITLSREYLEQYDWNVITEKYAGIYQ
jgi:glycosyltransferase involved in cell wall biosynthesis